ncbi:MAG: DUF7144 family membrane protein [Solirubrobacteraceae bacterium]
MAGYDTLSSGQQDVTARAARTDPTAEHGYGWVLFAGIMLAVAGTMNFIYGLAAISNSKFYAHGVTYMVSNLNTYGWVLLCIGVVQFLVALAIWAGSEWGRWLGIIAASVNGIIQLTFLPSFPFASLAVFTLDILVIYGLAAYGGHKLRGA